MRDFLPSEVGVAIFVALAIQIGAGLALRAAALEQHAALPDIDKGAATPVRVIPVLDEDAPILKLGSKGKKPKLPDRWLKQTPKPLVEQKAFVSPQADKTEAAIPPPD